MRPADQIPEILLEILVHQLIILHSAKPDTSCLESYSPANCPTLGDRERIFS